MESMIGYDQLVCTATDPGSVLIITLPWSFPMLILMRICFPWALPVPPWSWSASKRLIFPPALSPLYKHAPQDCLSLRILLQQSLTHTIVKQCFHSHPSFNSGILSTLDYPYLSVGKTTNPSWVIPWMPIDTLCWSGCALIEQASQSRLLIEWNLLQVLPRTHWPILGILHHHLDSNNPLRHG